MCSNSYFPNHRAWGLPHNILFGKECYECSSIDECEISLIYFFADADSPSFKFSMFLINFFM